MSLPHLALSAFLLGLLTLSSYLDRLYAEIGKFLSREFQDNIDSYENHVEPVLWASRDRAVLSVGLVRQLTVAALALLVGYNTFFGHPWDVPDVLQAAASMLIFITIFGHAIPYFLFAYTEGEWLRNFIWVLRVLIWIMMPLTVILGFSQSVAALTSGAEHHEPAPEDQSDAVEALIEAGKEEGILGEEDRDLIQSVVEFGDKTVREAMRPRPEVFAVSGETTVEKFIEMLRDKPYSRVPVYEGTIHSICGIVYAQDVLQIPDTEAATRRVDSLMRADVYFVPESKRTNDLLREMQKKNIRIAVVVDEYGGTAGVVTMEDLVEEIVGEIRDEHEPESDYIREGEHTYVVQGNMDVDRLEELFGVVPADTAATTVAGMVTELAGRIPRKGEIVEDEALRIEVLEATDRRVEKVRITFLNQQQIKEQIKA